VADKTNQEVDSEHGSVHIKMGDQNSKKMCKLVVEQIYSKYSATAMVLFLNCSYSVYGTVLSMDSFSLYYGSNRP